MDCWNSLVVVTQNGPAIRHTPKCYGISLRCTERDKVQPMSVTDSDQSQFLRSRVLRSQCLRTRTVGTRRTLQGTLLHRLQFVSRWTKIRQDTFYSAGTRRTQTYRNTMHCNTTVDTRKTFVGESSGHEEQHCRCLHETSGWIANAVARKETWTSNPGRYECYGRGRLRAFEQRFQSCRSASILSFTSNIVPSFFFFLLQLVHSQIQLSFILRALTSGSSRPCVNRVF